MTDTGEALKTKRLSFCIDILHWKAPHHQKGSYYQRLLFHLRDVAARQGKLCLLYISSSHPPVNCLPPFETQDGS